MKKFSPFVFILLVLTSQSCSEQNEVNSEKLWTETDRTYLLVNLERTRTELMSETQNLTPEQWNFQLDSVSWSIAEVVEHLVLQEEAYFRELSVIAASPPRPEFVNTVKGNDEKFLEYATDPKPGKASWYAEPKGRFCKKTDALNAFNTARTKAENLVKNAKSDFRKQFTFRNIPEKKIAENPEFYRIRQVRDLYQLVLNNIAHTDRHLNQIRRIKNSLPE